MLLYCVVKGEAECLGKSFPRLDKTVVLNGTATSPNRLILIAEKDTVYKKFPTPLINRLEKHFVLTSSVLEDWQNDILRVFDKWIQKFSTTR